MNMAGIAKNKLLCCIISIAVVLSVFIPAFSVSAAWTLPDPSAANTAIFNLDGSIGYISCVGLADGVKVNAYLSNASNTPLVSFDARDNNVGFAALSGLEVNGGSLWVTFAYGGNTTAKKEILYAAKSAGPNAEIRTTKDNESGADGGFSDLATTVGIGEYFYVSVHMGGYANFDHVTIPIHFNENVVQLVKYGNDAAISGRYTGTDAMQLGAFVFPSSAKADYANDSSFIVDNNSGLAQVMLANKEWSLITPVAPLMAKANVLAMKFKVIASGSPDLRFAVKDDGASENGFNVTEPSGLDLNRTITYKYTPPTLGAAGYTIIDPINRGFIDYTKGAGTDTVKLNSLAAGSVVYVYAASAGSPLDTVTGIPVGAIPLNAGGWTAAADGTVTNSLANSALGNKVLYFVVQNSAALTQTKALPLDYSSVDAALVTLKYYHENGTEMATNYEITTGENFYVKVFIKGKSDFRANTISLPIHFDPNMVTIVGEDGVPYSGNSITDAQLKTGNDGIKWGDNLMSGSNALMSLTGNSLISNNTGLIKITAMSPDSTVAALDIGDTDKHILTFKLMARAKYDPGIRYAYSGDGAAQAKERQPYYYDVMSPNGATVIYIENFYPVYVYPGLSVAGNQITLGEDIKDFELVFNKVPSTVQYTGKGNYPALDDGANEANSIVFYSTWTGEAYVEPGFDVVNTKDYNGNELFAADGKLNAGCSVTMNVYEYSGGKGSLVTTIEKGPGETLAGYNIPEIMSGITLRDIRVTLDPLDPGTPPAYVGDENLALPAYQSYLSAVLAAKVKKVPNYFAKYVIEYQLFSGDKALVSQLIERKVLVRYMLGDLDMNIAVNSSDETLAMRRLLLGTYAYSAFSMTGKPAEEVFVYVADVNGDGVFNSTDTTIITRDYLNIIKINRDNEKKLKPYWDLTKPNV